MVVVQIIDCFDQPSGIVVRSQTYPTWSDPKNPKRQQQEIYTKCQPQGVAEFVMEVDPEADEGTEPEASKDARRQAIPPQTKLSRGTQIPEYVLRGCLTAFKSRNPPNCLYSNPGPKLKFLHSSHSGVTCHPTSHAKHSIFVVQKRPDGTSSEEARCSQRRVVFINFPQQV
jgi:hypothetical protein